MLTSISTGRTLNGVAAGVEVTFTVDDLLHYSVSYQVAYPGEFSIEGEWSLADVELGIAHIPLRIVERHDERPMYGRHSTSLRLEGFVSELRASSAVVSALPDGPPEKQVSFLRSYALDLDGDI